MQIKEAPIALGRGVVTQISMRANATVLSLSTEGHGVTATLVYAEPDYSNLPGAVNANSIPPMVTHQFVALSEGDTVPRGSTYMGSAPDSSDGSTQNAHVFLLGAEAPTLAPTPAPTLS